MSNTAIIGGGIIGLATAYHLSLHQSPSTLHLIEATHFHLSASAHAGGFLSRNWFGTAVSSLGAFSFSEHARFSARHGGDTKWAYSRVTTLSQFEGVVGGGRKGTGFDWLFTGDSRATAAVGVRCGVVEGPEWLEKGKGDVVQQIAEDGDTAQVDPKALCEFLLSECRARGVHIYANTQATSIIQDSLGTFSGLNLSSSDSTVPSQIPCTRLLLSAGSWTSKVFSHLFPSASATPNIISMPGYSIIFQHDTGDDLYAIFNSAYPDFAPEFFTRKPVSGSSSTGGEIWLGGLNPDLPLPDLPTGEANDGEAIGKLKTAARSLVKGEGKFVRENLCFRPTTPSGLPIMGRLEDERMGGGFKTVKNDKGGVFISTGHGPWGISMGLGSGIVMAELMQGRSLSADISHLKNWE